MSAAEGFRFRLRFRVANRFTSDTNEVRIDAPELPNGIALTSQDPLQKIEETDWLVLGSRGYGSEQDARANGHLLTNALLLAAAQRSIGVDIGTDQTTSGMEDTFRAQVQAKLGFPIRNTVHGLDVFDDIEVRVIRVDATAELRTSMDMFVAALHQMLPLAPYVEETERLCGQLINDSLFPTTSESALIILMTCAELLCGRPLRKQPVVDLLDVLGRHLMELEANGDDKHEVREILVQGKNRSVRRSCLDTIRALLDEDRAREFDLLYQARSRFAHHGRGRASLAQESNSARRLATDLLIAHLWKKKAAHEGG